ncbi:MAG: LytTR family DNA-binding domain-containing protein, partial [Betaproteobacteria bacterium]|nr:LytTR family DNA-binding domain-containing protein [Betaproteobacteria bacterium]
QSLKDALALAWPELQVIALAPNGIEALRLAETEHPEVAFLDIRMPGLSGLEVAAELADKLNEDEPVPRIVFVTAYDEYALKAFELAAVDYLLKPVSAERLAKAVERLKAQLAAPQEDLAQLVSKLQRVIGAGMADPGAGSGAGPLTIIRAAVGNTVRMIPVEEVCYFQSGDKYTSVITRDAEVLIRTPLKELLAQLPQDRFRQIHRSTVVNLAQVAAAVRDDAGRLSLRLKQREETLAVSRVYAELFRQM